MNNTAWWIIIFILILLILAAGEIYRETHTFRVRKYKVKTNKMQQKYRKILERIWNGYIATYTL